MIATPKPTVSYGQVNTARQPVVIPPSLGGLCGFSSLAVVFVCH
jgi:hypothetical protein